MRFMYLLPDNSNKYTLPVHWHFLRFIINSARLHWMRVTHQYWNSFLFPPLHCIVRERSDCLVSWNSKPLWGIFLSFSLCLINGNNDNFENCNFVQFTILSELEHRKEMFTDKLRTHSNYLIGTLWKLSNCMSLNTHGANCSCRRVQNGK